MSTFQVIVLGVCAALVLIGIGVFASFGGIGGSSAGAVTIWGTVEESVMDELISTMRKNDNTFEEVSYVGKDVASYQGELVNAMAAGTGPDLILLSDADLHAFEDKIITIPYGVVSQSSFLNSFVDGARIFLTEEGALALPLMLDPLVMYWNRSLFSSAGVAAPPAHWNELLSIAPKITSIEAGSAIRRSAAALGQWQNVAHAKAILSTLFIQAGDNIVTRRADGTLNAVFGSTPDNAPSNPAESALRFYTEFTNPSKTTYSWNRTLPLSTTAFLGGDVALYFGFASEYPILAARNPNLQFSVAPVPQVEGSSSRVTYGKLTGLAIPRTSRNANGAAQVAQKLASARSVRALAELTGLPPVRRDVRLDTSSNAAMSVFVESALIARPWLDPNPMQTDIVFRTMVESVISGRLSSGAAVSEAARAFDALVE